MRRAVTTIFIVSLLLGSGCTTMHVHTLIFDKNFSNKGGFLESKVKFVAGLRWAKINDGDYDEARDRLLNQQVTLVTTLKNNPGTPNKPILPSGAATTLLQSLQNSINADFQKSKLNYSDAHDRVSAAADPKLSAVEREQKYSDAWALILTADSRLATLQLSLASIASKLGAALQAVPATSAIGAALQGPVATEVKTATSQVVNTLIGDQGIQSDPMASLIVDAPKEAWEGLANRSDAGGTIGDTDIAVKMDSIGEFTIKGVRNDTAKMTTATFQGLNQAVKLAAAAYGIPLPAGNSAPTGSSQAGGGISTPAAPVFDPAQAAKNRAASRAAALTLLQQIVSEQADLDAGVAAQTQTAIGKIQSSFTAEKAQITIKE